MHWPRVNPVFGSQSVPSYNAAPGTYRPLLRVVDDNLVIEDRFWGYRAACAVGKVPIAINARVEKLANRYWTPLFRNGRAIIPAAGRYEWTGEKGSKQPWHVHLKTREPMFIAAIAALGPPREHALESGFVIVTADAEGGMVDVHDRRPIVFSVRDAALWLDPDRPPHQAEQLARSMALGEDAFEWHPVSKDVARATNEGAHLAARLELPLSKGLASPG